MGIAINKFKIMQMSNPLSDPDRDRKNQIKSHINMLLYFLPSGTKHISTEQKPIVTLCIEYELKFENEIFVDDAEIVMKEDNFRREVITIEKEGILNDIIQFNSHNAFNFNDFVKTKYYESSDDEGKYITMGEAKRRTLRSIK